MDDDEFEAILADEKVKAEEKRIHDEARAIEIEREQRLLKAFGEMNNTHVCTFQRETGEYPELDELAFPPPPPESFWRWCAERLIRVADHLVEENWVSDLEQMDPENRNGKIAIGLLRHAMKKDVDSLAEKLKIAIPRGDDGSEVQYWLGTRIVGKLRGLFQVERRTPQVDPEEEDRSPEEDTSDPPKKRKMTWQEVAEVLDRMFENGIEFTSAERMAVDLKCAPNTVRHALKKVKHLGKWAERSKKAKSRGFTDFHLATRAQTREKNPAEAVLDLDEADRVFKRLIENAESKRRGELLSLQEAFRGDPDGFCVWIDQLIDEESDGS